MPGNAAWQFMIARSRGSGRRAWWRIGGGDAGVAGQPHDGDGEVAQGCHDARAACGADLGAVLAGVHVADPVKAVLDA